MRRILKKIHQVVGLFVALYMLVMALTGTLLVYKDAILRTAVPELATTVATHTAASQATILEKLERQYQSPGVRSIKLPRDGVNAYKLYLNDKTEFLVNAETLEPVYDPIHMVPLFAFLFDVHHRLTFGEIGEEVVGILGLFACFSLLSGLYLWWPWRKGLRLSTAVPANSRAASYRGAHVTTGIIVAPLLLVATATGTAMIYSSAVRSGLTALLGGEQPTVTQMLPQATEVRATLFDQKDRVFAVGMSTLYIPPRGQSGVYSIRLKMPDEWHPNGRSTVKVDPEGQTVVTYNAPDAALGHNVADTIYPLHSGKTGGLLWQFLIALSGVATFYLCYLGLSAYVKRRRMRHVSAGAK